MTSYRKGDWVRVLDKGAEWVTLSWCESFKRNKMIGRTFRVENSPCERWILLDNLYFYDEWVERVEVSMSKWNVGDRVRVKKKEPGWDNVPPCWVPMMDSACGNEY